MVANPQNIRLTFDECNTGQNRKCRHGKKFKEMAERLNRTYGLHIVTEVDLSQYKRRKGTPSLSYWFVKKIYM